MRLRWLVLGLGLVACGSPKEQPPPDEMPDAAAPDAPPDAAGVDTTIVVSLNSAPDVGVPVVFQNADGSVVATVMTDATGSAHAGLTAPATVSVLQLFRVSTFVAVPPGEHLVLDDIQGSRPTQHVTITTPLDPTPGVTSYLVNHGCGTVFGKDVRLPIICGSSEDLLVRSRGADDIGMLVAKDVPIVAGTMTVTGSFVPVTPETYTVTNVPSVSATMSLGYISSHGPLIFANVALDTSSGSASTTQGSIVAAGLNQNVLVRVDGPMNGSGQDVNSIEPTSTSFALDFGAELLPTYTAAGFDVANHRVTWQPTGGAQTPDLTIARIVVARGVNGGRLWEWHVAAPYVAGELALPVLPVLDFDFNPRPTDTVNVFTIEQARLPGGYDAVRAHALSDIEDGNVAGVFPLHADLPVPSRTAAVYLAQ